LPGHFKKQVTLWALGAGKKKKKILFAV